MTENIMHGDIVSLVNSLDRENPARDRETLEKLRQYVDNQEAFCISEATMALIQVTLDAHSG